MKRQYREMPEATKQKISQAMKGRSKSYLHRERISSSMKEYWAGVPAKPVDGN